MTLAETIANYAGRPSGEASELAQIAFQAVYDRTARPLWAYLARASGGRDVADDLLQETYCRFLVRYSSGAIKTKEGCVDEVATRRYLFRIANNLLNDRWRHDIVEVDIDEEQVCHLSVEEPDAAVQIDVRHVMNSLKPRQRQILWLAYVEGMSHAEIAAVTGLHALSIRLLLFRARRAAAALLSPEEKGKG